MTVASPSPQMAKLSLNGAWLGHVNFMGTNHISGTADCFRWMVSMVNWWRSWSPVYHIPSTFVYNAVSLSHCIARICQRHLWKLFPNHIFGIGEARHLKFFCADWHTGVLVHAWLITPKGMCSESHDFFEFWKISDNIWLIVQDRGMRYGRLTYSQKLMRWPA